MAYNNIMDKLRNFFGLAHNPKNEFRNPIWGSDDDEDDNDELYSKHFMESSTDSTEIDVEFKKQMHSMLKSFGNIFGDMKSLLDDDVFDFQNQITELPPEDFANNNSIRNYYLKPGYNSESKDGDLDGQITSNDLSELYRNKVDNESNTPLTPFMSKLGPGKFFCKTIITTSVTKPDGTVETRRIVKNGNEVIEETTTSIDPTPISSVPTSLTTGMIYSNIFMDIASFLRNIH